MEKTHRSISDLKTSQRYVIISAKSPEIRLKKVSVTYNP